MQRKALKQLGKVTQWTNEKVFSGEKTQLSSEFTQFEKDIEIKKNGIERLHAVSEPFFGQITRRKPTADPLPPSGSGKDKILYTEAVGLVMIDYGDAMVGGFGDSLAKYGRARCRMAGVQEEFGTQLEEGYMANLEQAKTTVSEYKSQRKKLDSRRLALDAAISKLNSNKKGDPKMLEEDVELARMRFEEVEEECVLQGEQIAGLEQDQYDGLTALLEAELEYFTQCKQILADLKESWPEGPTGGTSVNRPRAKSNASAKSFARGNSRGYSRQSAPASDDEESTPNRARSQSNASSSGKTKRSSMLPSFGSFGKKSGLANVTGSASKPRKSNGRGESRMALHSEEEDDINDNGRGMPYMSSSRNRSGSTLSASVSRMSLASQSLNTNEPPPRIRRTNTAPANSARYVRAKHEYAGGAHDELPLRVGQIVEIKQVVNDDWYIGESEGESGLFPSSYCEEHIVNPITGAGAPPMPKRSLPPAAGGASRTLAPPVSYRSPSPGLGPYDHSESEFDSQGYDDADHYATAAIVSAPQANPVSRNNTPSPALVGGIKKKAPPPPPSRRSQSSSNILAASTSSSFLTPPQASYRQRSNTATQSVSAEASPFGGSDDEPEQDQELEYLSSSPSHAGGRGNGLGAMHLGGGGGGALDMGDCGICGCDDFTQNAFKAKGTCSTCFHQHA